MQHTTSKRSSELADIVLRAPSQPRLRPGRAPGSSWWLVDAQSVAVLAMLIAVIAGVVAAVAQRTDDTRATLPRPAVGTRDTPSTAATSKPVSTHTQPALAGVAVAQALQRRDRVGRLVVDVAIRNASVTSIARGELRSVVLAGGQIAATTDIGRIDAGRSRHVSIPVGRCLSRAEAPVVVVIPRSNRADIRPRVVAIPSSRDCP